MGLIGKEVNVVPLIKVSLTVEKAEYQAKADVVEVTIKNHTAIPFILANLSDYTFHAHSDIVTVPPYESVDIVVKTKERLVNFNLPFKVMNGIIAPNVHPDVVFEVQAK